MDSTNLYLFFILLFSEPLVIIFFLLFCSEFIVIEFWLAGESVLPCQFSTNLFVTI